VDQIQRLRKKMDLPKRVWTEEELAAVADLTSERDHLTAQVPVHDEIHELRRRLAMPRREFTEADLTGPTSVPERGAERDELRDMLTRKQLCDPLCAEVGTVVTPVLHCCHSVVTLLPLCCYTAATLLLHHCYIAATLLLHYCQTARYRRFARTWSCPSARSASTS
jgi:hypothetical protein